MLPTVPLSGNSHYWHPETRSLSGPRHALFFLVTFLHIELLYAACKNVIGRNPASNPTIPDAYPTSSHPESGSRDVDELEPEDYSSL